MTRQQRLRYLLQDQDELIRRVRRLEASGSKYIADAQQVLDEIEAKLDDALAEATEDLDTFLTVVAA